MRVRWGAWVVAGVAVSLTFVLLSGCAPAAPEDMRSQAVAATRAMAADDAAAFAATQKAPTRAAPELGGLRQMVFGTRDVVKVSSVSPGTPELVQKQPPRWMVPVTIVFDSPSGVSTTDAIVIIDAGRVLMVER